MKRYIRGFNGLRTIGVVIVMGYHLWPNRVKGGFLGVDLFFVLSSYLVTDSLLNNYESKGTFELFIFWKKRLKRIYPLLVCIFLAVTPYILFFQRNLWAGLRANFLSAIFSVQNWWQISQGNSYFTDSNGPSPFKHLYYLSIEGQFFLVWPIILYIGIKLIKKRSMLFFLTQLVGLFSAALMAILFVPGTDPTLVYYGTDTRLFSLLIGASLALIWPTTRLSPKVEEKAIKISWQLLILVLILLFGSYICMSAQNTITYYGGMWLVSIASMILVALVAHPGFPIGRLFSIPFFDYIGSRSYGIYLWQLPVFTFSEIKVLRSTSLKNVIWEISIVLILSEISYRFVECPTKKYSLIIFLKKYLNFRKSELLKYKLICLTILGSILLILGVIIFSPQPPKDQPEIVKNIMRQQAILSSKNQVLNHSKIKNNGSTKNVSDTVKNLGTKYQLSTINVLRISKMKIFAIGDSVMIAASPNLQELFPKIIIDASVGRQASTVPKVLKDSTDKVSHSDVILIGLGTNGLIQPADIKSVLKAAGGRTVYWVTNHADRVWVKSNNNLLFEMSQHNNNLKLIDWDQVSSNHTEWFYSDGIHPYGEGAKNYTSLVAKAIIHK